MAAEERCWFTLDPSSQPVGPYTAAELTGFAQSGLLLEAQVFWREGRAAWDKLADVPELSTALAAARAHKAAATAADPAAGAAAAQPSHPQQQQQQQHHHHQVVISAKPSDPLEAFKNEIAAVEADEAAAGGGGAAAAGNDDERPGTPEELEFEDDDGTVYRWDALLRKYVPAAEADAAAAAAAGAATNGDPKAAAAGQQQQQQKQQDYDVDAMTFVEEEEIIPTLAAARAAEAAAADAAANGEKGGKKRAAGSAAGGSEAPAKKARQQQQAAAGDGAGAGPEAGGNSAAADGGQPGGWFELRVNTSVYVMGLPPDTDVDEVATVFSKCGIIKLDDNAQPRIKLYRDKETGELKGDGLVTYLKEPSVALAVQILDGDTFRPGSGPPMSVTPARFEPKAGKQGGGGGKAKPAAAAGGGGGKGGKGGRGGGRGRGKKRGGLSQLDKLEKKLGWGGFDDALPHERVTVVLKHMFTPDEAAAGGSGFAAELEADVLAECAKLGTVEKVRVFACHPEGVVTVRFKQEEPAQACLARMNGRFFSGRQLVAHMWDGFTSYHVKVDKQEAAEEEAARLEAFARELEQQQAARDSTAAAEAAAVEAAGAGAGVAEASNVAAAVFEKVAGE